MALVIFVVCLYINTVVKLKPTFSQKGRLQGNCAICRMHFSEGFNKVTWRQVKLNPVDCFSGSDSSPESILGEYSGWERRGLFMQSDWMLSLFSLCIWSNWRYSGSGKLAQLPGRPGRPEHPQDGKWWSISMRDTSLRSKFVFKPHLCFVMKFWKISSFDCRS